MIIIKLPKWHFKFLVARTHDKHIQLYFQWNRLHSLIDLIYIHGEFSNPSKTIFVPCILRYYYIIYIYDIRMLYNVPSTYIYQFCSYAHYSVQFCSKLYHSSSCLRSRSKEEKEERFSIISAASSDLLMTN